MSFSSPATDIVSMLLRRALPFLTTFVLVLLAYMPGLVPALGTVMPPLPLIPLFYWSIHRPDWFGAISSFALGLLVDLLLGAPLGVTAGLYAVSHLLLMQQQRFFRGSPFHVLWAGYAVTQLTVTLGQALLWWTIADVTPRFLVLLGINVLGLALFPLVCAVLARLHKWLKE
ncbi:MAG: rod shape-determining protein MreD [Bdellovibrionales bacterium]